MLIYSRKNSMIIVLTIQPLLLFDKNEAKNYTNEGPLIK